MPEDPVLEVTKAQKALQTLLRELENLKAEVGKYSAASRALEPAADAVRSASGALSSTCDRFTDYAKVIAATDLASVSESLRAITAEVRDVGTTLKETQNQLVISADSVSRLAETVLTRERLVEELVSLQNGLDAADKASGRRDEELAGLVVSQCATIAAASTANHGDTRNAIAVATTSVQKDIQSSERVLTSQLKGLVAQVQTVQEASNGLRTLTVVGAVIALAAAVFAYLGWHR